MESELVKNYFEDMRVVCDYARAVREVGLWESERIVVERFVSKDAKILELGCGAGRIAIGLGKIGYTDIAAIDFSSNMIDVAKLIGKEMGYKIKFSEGDATNLKFSDGQFDAVIFGFNGLMQIPRRANRKRALTEIRRVLRPEGVFIFTTHDRSINPDYWEKEAAKWERGNSDALLDEFGDKYYAGEHGNIYIHSPEDAEIESDLISCGFKTVFKAFRSDICQESMPVRNFSDECVFRAAKYSDKYQKNKL